MAIPAAILGLGKQLIAKAIMTKVTKEMNDKYEDIKAKNTDGEVIALTNTIEKAVISKKKASGWVGVVIALVYFASSAGYISPEIANLVDTLLSNPEVVEAIEGAVE